MDDFKLIQAASAEEAVQAMKSCQGKAVWKAGGTDLLGGMKREIYPVYPEYVIDLSGIRELDYIIEEKDVIRIGALTSLKTLAASPVIREKAAALGQAAERTASPHLRAMGTFGGNLCQENRCWYYRAKENYFPCKMKGGKRCYAPVGDNRIHSIFGGEGGCFAVNPSDTAPAVSALGGRIITTQRTIDAEAFWQVSPERSTALERDELVTEIQIPIVPGARSGFLKQALRHSIDFAMVNCAVMTSQDQVRICLNAVSPRPYRAVQAEEYLKGRIPDEETAEKAGELAIAGARALSKNSHKIPIAKAMVKRLLLQCAEIQ